MNRQPLLNSKEARGALSKFINEYIESKNIDLKTMYINPEHIHFLIELPTNQTIEDIVKLIKGSSSHWITQNDVVKPEFAWAVGYAGFTVSKSNSDRVYRYILNQQEHHKKVSFRQEYEAFIKKHGIVKTDESVG